jgi:hypothetical protein
LQSHPEEFDGFLRRFSPGWWIVRLIDSDQIPLAGEFL